MSKTLRSGMTLLALVAGAALSTQALAQGEKPKTPPQPISPNVKQPAAGEKPSKDDWKKAGPLSPEAIELAKNMTGDWNTESSFWTDPKAPPQTAQGHANFNPIMGARFIKQTSETDMEGEKFKGEGLFAYNTVSKEYETTWIDSSATGIMLSVGHKDEKGDIVFRGQYDHPMSGKDTTAKSVFHFEGHDKMVYTIYDEGSGGTATKKIEVVFTRATPMGKQAPHGDQPQPPKTDGGKKPSGG
jgi:hypothetical protein